MRERIKLIGNLCAEAQQLTHQRIQWSACLGCACEQRRRILLQIFLHILKIVAKLKQDTPIEGETGLRSCQGSVAEARIRQNGGAPFGATQPQKLCVGKRGASSLRRNAVFLRLVDREQDFKNPRKPGWNRQWSARSPAARSFLSA